jgi:hypothetical protein
MTTLFHQLMGHFSPFQAAIWVWYLLAAVMLPANHVRPILRYLRGNSGIGDACMRTETIQCLWRVPALMFSVFVAPSAPLFLSVFLDLLGRIGRIVAMHGSHRRWLAARSLARPDPTLSPGHRPGFKGVPE